MTCDISIQSGLAQNRPTYKNAQIRTYACLPPTVVLGKQLVFRKQIKKTLELTFTIVIIKNKEKKEFDSKIIDILHPYRYV